LRVVDAGVIVELVANDLEPDRLGDEELAVPHLIDSEVTSLLRRLVDLPSTWRQGRPIMVALEMSGRNSHGSARSHSLVSPGVGPVMGGVWSGRSGRQGGEGSG